MGAENPLRHEWALHGADQPSVIAAGHSHVACMLIAIRDGLCTEQSSAAVAYGADLTAGPPSGRLYWDFVLTMAEGRVLAISWNGNQHHAGFLVAPDPPMRVHDAQRPDGPDGYGVWVPLEMLRSHWDPSFDELDDVLNRVSANTSVVILATPPPKRDAAVRATLIGERMFTGHAERTGTDVEQLVLTAEHDRLAMWKLLQDMLQTRADSAGVRFLPVPDQATDSEGFLLAEYSSPDATHANGAYGALVWSALSQGTNLARALTPGVLSA